MWTAKRSDGWWKIEVDEMVGYYVQKFDQTGKRVADHLQDSFESAISFAKEVYGIDESLWENTSE